MKWFRRELDDFNVDWELSGTRYNPVLPLPPQPFPTPWRNHPQANECILLPKTLCQFFAEDTKIRNILRSEPNKISELRASINEEGLKTPLKMTWDPNGKIRYHDGYHRLAAMLTLDEPTSLPVILTRSDRIKAYGRQPEQYVQILFEELDRAITIS